MDAYSLDLQERVAAACDGGDLSQPEVAEAFGVSLSFVTKLLRRRRQTGSVAAKPHTGGYAPRLNQKDQSKLRGLVGKQPDATLEEYCQALARQGSANFSASTMCRVLTALGLPRKKSPCMPPNATRRACKGSGGCTPGKWPACRWTSG
jgi:transposase